jgi:hypothetical protein
MYGYEKEKRSRSGVGEKTRSEFNSRAKTRDCAEGNCNQMGEKEAGEG